MLKSGINLTLIVHMVTKIATKIGRNRSGNFSPLILYLIETPFDTFANRADPDQEVRAARLGSTLFAYGYMIRYDPTLVDLTSKSFVLYTNVKIYIIIHSG